MNEKNQIRLFRDPLDPRELDFGFSQPHTEPSPTSGTGKPSTPNEKKFVVRLYDGFDYIWMDISEPVSKEEADKIWKEKTANGTKNTNYDHIDYYAIFPADTQMLFNSKSAPVSSPDNQPRMDEKTLARSGDPATSKAAAKTVKRFAKDYHAKILEALNLPYVEMTFYEIAERANLEPSQVWRRLNELQRKGLIEPTGEERKGPTGRLCRAWRLKGL